MRIRSERIPALSGQCFSKERIDRDQPHLQHIEERCNRQLAILDGDLVAADGGDGAENQVFTFLLGRQLYGAHGDPLVEGAAAAAADDFFRDQVLTVGKSFQRQADVQHLLRGKRRIPVGEGHVKPFAQRVQVGKVPVIVEQNAIALTLSGSEPALSFSKQRIAQLPEQREGIIAGLWDPVRSEHTQPAEEHLFRLRAFAHPIRQRPIGKAVQFVVIFQNPLHDIAGFEAGIIQQILLAGGVVPFRQVDRQLLQMELPPVSQHLIPKLIENTFFACL